MFIENSILRKSLKELNLLSDKGIMLKINLEYVFYNLFFYFPSYFEVSFLIRFQNFIWLKFY